MKYLMSSVLFLIILTYGCKENYTEPDIANPYLYNSAIGLSNVGNEHNLILDYLSLDSTFSIADTIESRRLFNSSLSYLTQINPNCDSVIVSYYALPMVDFIVGKNIDSVLEDHFDAIFPALSLKLSQVEIDMINEARNYLYNYDFSGMTNLQVYNHVISKADSLLIDFNAIDWDTVSSASYMKGEAIGGFLLVMKNSAEYWKTQAPTDVTAPIAFLAADGSGYLIGWGRATLTELLDNGKLNINNSRHRINSGLSYSAFASGGKALTAIGGWLGRLFVSPA